VVVDAPRTPPARPHDPKTLLENLETAVMTVIKTPGPRSPSKSPSKQCFLTKETSTLTNFTAWDVDERLHEVEAQFRAMKDVMNSTITDRKGLDEALELAKTRGKWQIRRRRWGGKLIPSSERPGT
jgi:kinesin family protein C1